MAHSYESFKQCDSSSNLNFSGIIEHEEPSIHQQRGIINILKEYTVEATSIEDFSREHHSAPIKEAPSILYCTTTSIKAACRFPSPPRGSRSLSPRSRQPSAAASIKSFFSKKGVKNGRRRRSSTPPPTMSTEKNRERVASSRKTSIGRPIQKKIKEVHVDEAIPKKRWNLLQKLDMWKFPTATEERSPKTVLVDASGNHPPIPQLCDCGNLLCRTRSAVEADADTLGQKVKSADSESINGQDDEVSPTKETCGAFAAVRRYGSCTTFEQVGRHPVIEADSGSQSINLWRSPSNNTDFTSSNLEIRDGDWYSRCTRNVRSLRRSTTRWSSATCLRKLSTQNSAVSSKTAHASPVSVCAQRTESQPFARVEVESIAPTENSFDDVSFVSCNSSPCYDYVSTPDNTLGYGTWQCPSPRWSGTPIGETEVRASSWQKLQWNFGHTSARAKH